MNLIWVKVIVLGVVLGAIGYGINHYGDSRYQAGVDHEHNANEKAANKALAEANAKIATLQATVDGAAATHLASVTALQQRVDSLLHDADTADTAIRLCRRSAAVGHATSKDNQSVSPSNATRDAGGPAVPPGEDSGPDIKPALVQYGRDCELFREQVIELQSVAKACGSN